MSIATHFCDPLSWAQHHFGAAPLGDARRSRRLVLLAAGWCRQPGASIPRLNQGQAGASKAAYRLLDHPQATPDAFQQPHRHVVSHQLQAPGTYLLLEDTTELLWPEAATRRPGLGPVGPGTVRHQGVLLHSLLAAAWPADGPAPSRAQRPPLPLLGLLDQQFHVRQPAPDAEKAGPHNQARLRQARARESALWTQSLRAVGSPPPDTRWVVVADRGADVYEHLYQCQQQGLGFVVRAAQDRGLVVGPAKEPAGRLFERARAQPSQGTLALSLRGRPGQPARQVTLHLSWSPPLALRAPQRPGGATGKGAPVAATVVRVWEVRADGIPGLEWLLLTDFPVTDLAQAQAVGRQYASRWLIEEFHKALKTGLGAERLQLQTAARLFAAVAVLSVVALALVALREHSRQQPDAPAERAGLSVSYLRVLRGQCQRPLTTVREVYYALAGLGGHLGRAGDGPPGWQTLWRGLLSLRQLVEGVR
ncbi:IS4 family transposase, partial [Hymenobacter monticola]